MCKYLSSHVSNPPYQYMCQLQSFKKAWIIQKMIKNVSRKHTKEEQSLKISFFVSIQNQSKFLLGFSLMDQKNKYRLSEIS